MNRHCNNIKNQKIPGTKTKPILSGGTLIEGWSKVQGNLWKASIKPDGYIRQLFVDGKRQQRARHPNQGQAKKEIEIIFPKEELISFQNDD